VETFRQDGRLALSLDLGQALGVELRRAGDGVELTLAAAPSLAPAVRAALPRLLRALDARGVVVRKAEVRQRSAAGGPVVDAARGLR
jgi:hypothetical protein